MSPSWIEASSTCSETSEHRDGNYRRTEPRLGAVARVVRIAGTALSDLICSLLRLDQYSPKTGHALTSDFIVESEIRGSYNPYIYIFAFRRDSFRSSTLKTQ